MKGPTLNIPLLFCLIGTANVSANLNQILTNILTNYFRKFQPIYAARSLGSECPLSKPGTEAGEATMFQEDWVHGKTGACGFEKPFSSSASGLFAAVGGDDWAGGLGCGACAELQYEGRTVTVNVVDRCWGCSKGWFDLGGPAWRVLTGGQPPGHVYGVRSRWVTCPRSLTGGENLHVYVKPGSHAWDARFQPTYQARPVSQMLIDGGRGWQWMKKCENFFFCKPAGLTLHGQFSLRLVSDMGSFIDVTVPQLSSGSYVDTGTNNDAPCHGHKPSPTPPTPPQPTTTTTMSPTTTKSPTPVWGSGSRVDCSVEDGLFPDPDNCRGFIKCAQGDPYPMECGGGLYFDPVTYNCNWAWATQCNGRPVRRSWG